MKTRTLQEIKDLVAWEEGYTSWSKLLEDKKPDFMDNPINEVCRRAQLECGRATLEKAAEKALVYGKHPTNEARQKKIYANHSQWEIEVDKSSITSESNIVIIE